jgi:ribosome biogenesis GTPase
LQGQVIKLDRGFPLVRTEDGRSFRCELARAFEKSEDIRAVIGDKVLVLEPKGHDKGIIEKIEDRKTKLVRRDPAERTLPQILASNFDKVFVVHALSQLNTKRLERELVLAYETGADVALILTKDDEVEDEAETSKLLDTVQNILGAQTPIYLSSTIDATGIDEIRAAIPPQTLAILLGKSGVGKSSLINALVGKEVCPVGDVREADGKGRHTTVSREIIDIPGAGRIVDMPGVRGLGMWESDAGIAAAFPDIEAYAQRCRFRDCRHKNEPGCAVLAAVRAGELSKERLASYQSLKEESEKTAERKREASWRKEV